MSRALLLAGLALLAPLACAAAAPQEPAELHFARDAYRQCAMVRLPNRPSRTPLLRQAAEAAVDQCRAERLALTGRYALSHPGSQQVEHFDLQARQQLVDELTGWLTDLEAMYIERGQ